MRHTHTENDENITINLTPLIDIVFILLIFFIVSSSLVKDSGIKINRPTAQTATALESKPIVVAINAQQEISIDQQPIALRAVRMRIEALRAENSHDSIMLLADVATSTGLLIEVMDQIRLAGVSNIAIAATKP